MSKLSLPTELSHAYYLVGPLSISQELKAALKKSHNLVLEGNPDLFDRQYETFTIDDARQVKSVHETRPTTASGRRFFILAMNGITVEAQNALLKLLEEPASYAHFFLIVSSAHLLLPTVKSRLQQIVTDSVTNAEAQDEVKKFLKMSKPKQVEFIADLVGNISKEKLSKQSAIDFLNALEAVIYEEQGAKKSGAVLEKISFARKYIYDRAPSIKMLLEMVTLSL